MVGKGGCLRGRGGNVGLICTCWVPCHDISYGGWRMGIEGEHNEEDEGRKEGSKRREEEGMVG